ncbi:receptor-like protein 6 [Alnus glutinosa]|uniref:receptor-like protein 6 n=1 Tax=Alnus glutinosa TaxID=3517 RepID=UPI002D78CFA1|nr:receptor-like protein 6 [Alnus glutinosa]
MRSLAVFSWLFLIPVYSLFLISICVFEVSGQCLDDQQSLLLQLKNNLTISDPARSNKLVKWNQSVDCCSWEGVTCHEGRVIGLDLANESIWDSGLDDSSSLFSLQHLQSLSLADNDFNSSQIPSQFDKLANLSYLNLSNAGFAGQIPIAISRLTRLVTLDLSLQYYPYRILYPPLTLENPNLNMLVQNLSELMELYLDGIAISAQGKEWCRVLSSSLPNLRVLSLSYCNLLGPIDYSLRNLKSLSVIRLNGNNFSSPVPIFFADFKNLTSLEVSSSRLNGKFPKKILQVPTLQMIDLSYNNDLQGSFPEFLPNGSLQTMVLKRTNFSGTLPHSIGILKMLSTINLGNCNFSGSIPDSLASLTQLVYLDMSSNMFSGSIPDSLASLTQLVYLDMSSNMFSGSIPVFSMAKNLTNLDLSSNNLTGQITSTQWQELLKLESLYLHENSLNGNIPGSLFSLPSLQVLALRSNQFSGQLKEFSNVSSYILRSVYLDNNQLEGPVPMSIFELRGLVQLSLGSNKFNNSLDLRVIQLLKNLSFLDLSHINLLTEYNGFNLSLSSVPLSTLILASCKLKKIPDFLRNQSYLSSLDLSNNQIYGELPNWIWKLPHLEKLNLSYNYLKILEGPISNVFIGVLDFRSNQFQGQLPDLPLVTYLDFSMNNFRSTLPASIGQSLEFADFFSISSNKLYGSIPRSICKATNLQFLDLSDNYFSGTIPQCLIEMSGALQVLSLRRNNLNGTIPDTFPKSCNLQTLAVNKNHLEGKLPKSLKSCYLLEVLDIGNNHIEDTFPFYFTGLFKLKVLILRSNKLYGPIGHLELDAPWPMLQIMDVASNNFTGHLPIVLLSTWMVLTDRAHEVHSELSYLKIDMGMAYFQDTITIISKGLEVELVKILTIFTTIDFSCNNFDGPIPEEIGEFTLLYILNLSHNAFTGQIPASLGKLSNLESLDLSSNKLSGNIPVLLADGLIFLAVLNLSFNQLVGQIPFIKQFATFSENSFKGNERLCGLPLKSQCSHEEPRLSPPTTYEESHKSMIEWNYISAELGFVFGFGIVMGPLMFWKRWRIWYYKHVDDILFKIFPKLYVGNEYRRRPALNNKQPRH